MDNEEYCIFRILQLELFNNLTKEDNRYIRNKKALKRLDDNRITIRNQVRNHFNVYGRKKSSDRKLIDAMKPLEIINKKVIYHFD